MVGTFTVCADNLKENYPIITCQPMDQGGIPGGRATFYVEATGQNLSYKWFFLDLPNGQFVPKGNGPTLVIDPINTVNYGIYFCAITSETDAGPATVHSRQATLGGTRNAGGSGGAFVPTQYPAALGSGGGICGATVSGVYVRYGFFQPYYIPDPGVAGFKGNLWNVSVTPAVEEPNANYVLQYIRVGGASGCAVRDGTFDYKSPATPGLQHRWIVQFITAPTVGTKYELRGNWTTTFP
jgi:hypothetical protein